MASLFSAEWMNELKDAWNNDPEVSGKLAEIGFDSVITCGFKNEDDPRGVFVVEKGICTRAGDWNGEAPDWDMRADMDDWLKWVKKGIGMMGMGTAYATGKLKFKHRRLRRHDQRPAHGRPVRQELQPDEGQIGADELG
jgi:putative sterol carrier protein